MRRSLIATATIAALAAPIAALAATGHVARPVEVLAGPGEYPTVDRIPPGVPVEIFGCTEGYAWCDVSVQDVRGWIRGDAIHYDYRGSTVVLPDVDVDVGLPILNFEIGPYWEEHYRSRPFYHDIDRYRHDRR